MKDFLHELAVEHEFARNTALFLDYAGNEAKQYFYILDIRIRCGMKSGK